MALRWGLLCIPITLMGLVPILARSTPESPLQLSLAPREIVLENPQVRAVIVLSPVVALHSFVNKTSGGDLITDPSPGTPLVQFSGPKQQHQAVLSHLVRTLPDGTREARISLELGKAGARLLLEATLAPESPYLELGFRLDERYERDSEEVLFPVLPGIAGLHGERGDDELVWSKLSYGVRSTGIYRREGELEVLTQYPMDGLQFVCLQDRHGGFFLHTLDTEAHPKLFLWSGDERSRKLQVVHFLNLEQRGSEVVPYRVRLGVFRGSWETAAEHYASWARGQTWYLTAKKQLPAWFAEGLPVIHFYNHYFSAAKPVLPLAYIRSAARGYSARFRSPVIVLVHGWERFPNFMPPFYFPPAEGTAAFERFVRDVRADGNIPFVYLTASAWADTGDPGGELERLYRRFAPGNLVLNPDGRALDYLMLERTTGYHKVRACPTSKRFSDLVSETAAELVRLGFPILQLDEFPQGVLYPCYDRTHSHPPGYGPWLYRAYGTLVSGLRHKLKTLNPDLVLSAEEMTEVALPWFDTFVSRDNCPDFNVQTALADPRDRTVPLFAGVYHHLVPTFSQFDNSAYGFARAFVRGKLLHLTHMTSTMEEALDLFGLIVEAQRKELSEFVFHGVLLPGLELHTPDLTLRGSAFAATQPPDRPFTTEAVLHGVFRHQDRIACLFANVSPEKQVFSFSLPTTFFPTVTRGSLHVNRKPPQVLRELGAGRALTIELPALGIAYLLLSGE